MQTHFCRVEKTWLTFEHTCNWCGLNEQQANAPMTDAEFRQLMERLRADARPDINDD